MVCAGARYQFLIGFCAAGFKVKPFPLALPKMDNYPPLNEQQCGNCRFFSSKAETLGVCRRYPMKDSMLVGTISILHYRSPVSLSDWCGEWGQCQ